jgi:DNA-binding LytR/AlgR family response regulator
MNKFSCLIVEDEPLAAEIMADYIAQVPFLDNRGVCRDSIYALEVMQQEPIDVLFLDIHLPKIKGLDFIRTLKNPPLVIITTAYREYALEGYEVNAVDYLVKPVSFHRFLTAVNKLKQGTTIDEVMLPQDTVNEKPFLLINTNKKMIRVPTEEILFIESKKEYINIVTSANTYITKLQLGKIERQLNNYKFIRIHRSFVIAREKVTAFGAVQVEIGEIKLPIGRVYRDTALQILGKIS